MKRETKVRWKDLSDWTKMLMLPHELPIKSSLIIIIRPSWCLHDPPRVMERGTKGNQPWVPTMGGSMSVNLWYSLTWMYNNKVIKSYITMQQTCHPRNTSTGTRKILIIHKHWPSLIRMIPQYFFIHVPLPPSPHVNSYLWGVLLSQKNILHKQDYPRSCQTLCPWTPCFLSVASPANHHPTEWRF